LKIIKIALLVVFCTFVSIMLSSTVSGLEGFSNTKTINICPSTDGSLIDYQMSFDIGYESEMQSDFDDLRFTDENGILLPYWIESKTNSSETKVWVKIPVIDRTNGATVRMYYGNSTVSSESNGGSTFISFEDFEDSEGLEYFVESGESIIDGYMQVSSNNGNVYYNSADTYEIPYTIEFDAANWVTSWGHASVVPLQSNNYRLSLSNTRGSSTKDELCEYYSGTSHTLYDTLPYNDDTWYHWEMKIGSDNTVTVKRNGVVLHNSTNFSRDVDNIGNASFQLLVSGWSGGTGYIQVDNILVRQYEVNEPSYVVSSNELNIFDPSGFTNNKTITISPSSNGTLTDYQMSFDIDYEQEMQSDFDDMRFTNENGILIPYWIESMTNSSEAKVWVKVPEIDRTEGATVKMYYGNSAAVSKSDGEEVFEFFDDFSSSLDTDKWATVYNTPNGGNCNIATENGKLKVSVQGPAYAVQAEAYVKTQSSFNYENTPLEIEFSANQVISSGEGVWWKSGFILSNDTTMPNKRSGGSYTPDNGISIRQPQDGYRSEGTAIIAQSYVGNSPIPIYYTSHDPGSHKFNLIMDKENVTLYVDDVIVAENVKHNLTEYDSYIYFLRSSDQYIWNTQKWDYIIVRQRANDEPTYIIAEESTVPTSLIAIDMDTYMQWYWDAVTDADSYNVSLSDGWHNGTVSNTINDTSISAHGNSTITVFAYNTTYGLLSEGASSYQVLENNVIAITDVDNAEVMETETVNIDTNFTDIDADTATFSCNRTDLFTDFDIATGTGSWVTSRGDAGAHEILVGVSDGYGSSDVAVFTVTVNAAPVPDVPTNLQNTTGNFYVNWIWAGGENTDSYNVNLNDIWYNGTTSTTINDTDMPPHSTSSIKVYGFNETYGLLSGALSGSISLPNNPVTISGISDASIIAGQIINVDANFTDIDNYIGDNAASNWDFELGGTVDYGGITDWTNFNCYNSKIEVAGGGHRGYINDMYNGAPGGVYQDVDLTCIDTIELDMYYLNGVISGVNVDKRYFQIAVDGTVLSQYHNIKTSGDAIHMVGDVSGYEGIHRVQIQSKYCYVRFDDLTLIPQYDTATFGCNRTDLFTDFDTETGEGTWDSVAGQSGTYSVEFNVTDGFGSADSCVATYIVDAYDLAEPTNLINDATGNFYSYWSWIGNDELDSYNVSLNDVWYNGTIDTFINHTNMMPHSTSNIVVYGYNATYDLYSDPLTGNITLSNNPVTLMDVEGKNTTAGKTVNINANATDVDNIEGENPLANWHFTDGGTSDFGGIDDWIEDSNIYNSKIDSGTVGYFDYKTNNVYGTVRQTMDMTDIDEIEVYITQQWGSTGTLASEYRRQQIWIDNSSHVVYDSNAIGYGYTAHIDVSGYEGEHDFIFAVRNSGMRVDYVEAIPHYETLTFGCNRTDLFTDFDTETGEGTWTTSIGDDGTYYIDFNVTDSYGSTDSYVATFIIDEIIFEAPTNLTSTKGNFYVDWSWNAVTNADSYNVSLSDGWHNSTTNTINDSNISAHGNSTISVYGYNATYGLLSSPISSYQVLENNPVTISGLTSPVNVIQLETINVDVNYTDLDNDIVTFSCNRTDLFTDFNTSTGVGTWNTQASDYGTYEVEFTVDDGYDSIDSMIILFNVNTAQVAGFIVNVTSGTVPLSVQFTDTSTNNPANWFWDFGDNSTSAEQNPVHVYSDVGNFTVTLTTFGANGNASVTKSDYIMAINESSGPNNSSSSVRTIFISNSGSDGALTGFQYTLDDRTLPDNATGYEYLHYYYDLDFTQEIPQYRDETDNSVVTLKLNLNDGDTVIYERAEAEEAVSSIFSVFDLIEGLDTGGTITASRTPEVGAIANILDNSTSTYAYYKNDYSTYIIRDFGKPVCMYKLRAAFGSVYAIQYIKVSNDGSTWTTLASWSSDVYRHSVTPWYDVNNSWRYVKLEKSGAGWHSYCVLNVLSRQDTVNAVSHFYELPPLPNGTIDSNISVSFLEPGDYTMVQAGDSIDFILEARDNATKFNLDGFSGYVELEGPGNVSEQVFLSNVNGNLSGEYYVEESDPDGVWYATATVYNSTFVINESLIFFKTGTYIIQSYAESSAYITGQDINFTAIAFSADNFSQYLTVDDLNMSLELYPYNNSTSAFGPAIMQYDSDSHEFEYTVNSGSIGQGIYTAIITGNDGSGNIENASMQIGISDDFNVTVDVDSKYHDRAETVGIHGSAEYLDGTPMVNTSVSLLLDVDGFQRSYTVTTNETGDFTYDFEPLSNEAGTYLLDAYVTNNGIARSANTDFVIYGLRLSPSSPTVDMCENSTHGIQLELSNLGDTTLTGLFINLTDTDPADNVALVLNGSLPSELTPDESVPIWLNIEAGSLITDNSTFDIHIFSSQTECAANLTVNLFSDTPVLECQPGNIEVGLNKNQTATRTMTLYNSGYGNLENVTLQYSGSQWFTITTDTHLGDISSDANFSFDINLNSYNVGLGTYNDTVRVISDNHDDVQIGLTLYVTNLPSGSVNFNVSDSIGRQIPDANIILLNEETYEDYYGSTNSSGNALFTNLTVGKYLYDISSEGTNTLSQRGYLEVEPSPVADEVNINLMMQLGDYQSTLTPVNIEDMYQVILNGTFETDVPVPIITASPPSLVYSLEPGDEMSGHFKVTNYGLISAYDVSISAVSDEGMTIELLVDNIDNLEARSSVEIPFKIKINDSGIKDVKLKGQFDITSIYVHYVNDKKVASYVGTQVPVYVKIIDDVNLKINPQVIWINSVTDTTNLTSHLPVTYELCEDVLTAQNLETDNNIILSPVFGTSLKFGTGIGTDSIEDIVKGLWIPDGVSAWGGQFDPYVIEPSSTATLDLNKISMDFEILPTSFNLFTVAGEGGILGFSYGKVDLNVSQNDVDNTIPMYYYTERAWIPIVVTSTGYPQSLNDSYIIKQIFSGAKDIVSTVGGIPHAIISIIEDSGNDDNNDGSSSSDYSRTSGTSYIPPDDIEWITIPSTLLIEEPFSIMNETAHVKVKITIPQYVFMEREAFLFDAAVTNKDFNDEWENVSLDLNIRQNGTVVNDMFFVKTPTLSGINAINGSGVLSSSSSATAKWLIIPNTGTGGTNTEGENYTISTTISYSINGESYEMEMESFKFTVLPSPEMVLDYCIPANVEANESFKLMVVATNDGYGSANHFSIETSQPFIYENLSGLLIDFKITGSQLQGESRSNSLTVDFGNILPGESKIATWDMVTTLDGEFTEFTGEYTHDSELGGAATSLIREINTYIIQSSVDGIEESYDYIVTSKLNEEQYTLIDSSSGISRSVKNTNYTLVGNNTSSASLNVSLDTYANEWMIASIDDPFSNEVQIEKVVRTLDHSELPVQNSWLSGGKIFLLDYSNGSIDGNYTVKFEQADLQANFSASTTSGFEPLSVQFTDLSTDAETWAWDFGDGSNVSGTPAPTHVYVDNGVYNVTLTVADEDGEIETDNLKITVNNVAPVCDAGSNQLADEGDVVLFFGNYSDNCTADTHTIVWDFGDGFNVSDVLVPTHVYADDGVYNVTLIVIDDDGGIGTDTLEVTVNNVAPVCNAGFDQLVNEGDAVSFSGNYSDNGTADTHTIVWDFGDGSNSSDTLTPEHVYSDDGTYNVTLAVIDDDGGIGTDTLEVIVLSSNERIVTVNLQDSLGLPLTGGIVTYYDGGWQEFGTTDEYGKVSKQLPVGNYNFRTFYNHASNTKYQNIGTNSTVIFSTVDASVELRDSSGYLLDNGSVQYYSGGWYDFGTFVNGSSHMELLPNNYNFRMNYDHASNTRYQNIGTNSTVVFSTVDATVELRNSSGYLLDNGSVQYYSGGWYDFGTFVNGSSHMELLPNNYNFRMNYGHASNTMYQDIGINSTVVFSTVNASVELRDSNGNLLDNSSVHYYSGGWYDFGTSVNGSSHMELLPNNYNFRMNYQHASNTMYQDIRTNSTVVFSTVDTTVELRDSNGNLLNNGSVQYYSGGWHDLGTLVNGSSHMELLPNNYNFRMNYGHASNTKYQDIGTNSTVVFSTVDTTVELRNSSGNLLNNDGVQYYSGGWYDLGTFANGSSHMELLPNNYNFRMNYGHASNTMYQDIGTNSTVVFLTGKIISDSGTCTQYYSGGWQVFTNGMELLSGSYNFRFNDGTSDRYYSIESSTVNTIY
jgi:PKD repeat protein